MGFMGFGMQKWIYTMRPRKPFSKKRKGSFTVVPTHNRYFKLQPSKKSSTSFMLILILIMSLFVALCIPKWMTYEDLRYKNEIAQQSLKDNYAFQFLLTSGKRRLGVGRISGAYSEFKLAYAIKPDNKEVNALLLETLEILCQDYQRYCQNYKALVQRQ